MRASELIAVAEDLLPEVPGSGCDRSRSTRLGLALGRKRGRIFGGFRLQEVYIADDHCRLRTAWGLVSAAREPRRGDVERLDVGGQSPIAQDTELTEPNSIVGSESALES